MKSVFRSFIKKHRVIQTVAAILIVCMGLADASLYTRYVSSENDISNEMYLITEEHEIDNALADGSYDGNNSDSPSTENGIVEIVNGKQKFVVLEIVPSESRGVVGYTISGCEPFENAKGVWNSSKNEYIVTPEQMKDAYLDAYLNKNPGKDNNSSSQNNIPNALKELNSQINNQGVTYPFSFGTSDNGGGKYKGYYKYVGHNMGVYAYVGENYNGGYKDIEMTSRFYDYDSSKSYDYIFVYDASSSRTEDKNTDYNRRVRIIHNEKFIKDCMGKTDATTWRNNHACKVITRSPANVTMEDINEADVVFVANAREAVYYQWAREINNFLNGKNANEGKNSQFSETNDFRKINDTDFTGFEKTARLYERIVVREDCAIITEKGSFTGFKGNGIKTNLDKLLAMVYFVEKGGKRCEGRLLFTDFMKKYTSEPGTEFMKHREEFDAHRTWGWREEDETMGWIADPEYPDYRAMSLRVDIQDPVAEKNSPNYYYMHVHTGGGTVNGHVGHPIVVHAEDAITGGYFENGILIPKKGGPENLYPVTIVRNDDYMFKDANLTLIRNTMQRLGYYKDDDGYYKCRHGYESMSNTTDYIYIDNDGTLKVVNDYSSNDGKQYWFNIDYDGRIDPNSYSFRRIKWDAKDYDVWPWDSELTFWFFKTGYTDNNTGNYIGYDNYPGFRGNMHMWYDYNYFRNDKTRITATTNDNFMVGTVYRNSVFVQENEMFKTDTENWIFKSIDGRQFAREESDSSHVENYSKKDYTISMNILNGDGVNESPTAISKNKTLYYNEYELNKILLDESSANKAKIPIKLRLKSSCTMNYVSVHVGGKTGPVMVRYKFGAGDNGMEPEDEDITVTGSPGNRSLILTAKNTIDGTGYPETRTPGGEPIYTYEGAIYDVLADPNYKNKRNAKFTVELNVKLPDGSSKSVFDDITIVKRDFFQLD